MSHNIEEIQGRGGGNNVKKTLEKWGYTPGKGFASTASQQNSANNTTRENSNDRLNNSGVEAGMAGAGGVNAQIKATQSSGDSNTNQNSSQRNPDETTIATLAFSATSRASGSNNAAPVDGQISALFEGHFGKISEQNADAQQAHRKSLAERKQAINALNLANQRNNAGPISEATIETIATMGTVEDQNIDVQAIANSPTDRQIDPTQVKGRMAEGDSLDFA